MRGRWMVAVLSALTLVGVLAPPAVALDVRASSPERVLGGLSEQELRIRLDDGAVARGRALRFKEDDRALELRPRLAQRRVHGLQRVEAMAAQELGAGAVAGINGGYWIDLRSGNPNGLHVQQGRLTTTNASAGGGGFRSRSAVGITESGRLLLDQVATEMTLTLPSNETVDVRFMNRRVHAAGDVTVYDDQFGDAVLVPAGGVLVLVDGMRLRPGGSTNGTVVRVVQPTEDRFLTLERGQTAIVGHRSADVGSARSLRAGDRLSLTARIASTNGGGAWPSDLSGAVAGGGTLLRGGRIPTSTEWSREALAANHFSSRHPRTAVGRTGSGEILLVTVDGRQNGWSVGLTAPELAQVMRSLGARDAVNLDGGGSTTMTLNGTIANRPSENGRAVANGLFVYTEPPRAARRMDAHACPATRVPASPFGDVHRSSVHAPAVDCLAWWGVTQGTRAGTYDPSGTVTRAQMASFLARWLDGAARQGSARALPRHAALTFRDVAPTDTHASAIARLADAGIVEGRSARSYRPQDPVTRDQMASFIRRALEYSLGEQLPRGRDAFVDDNGSVHEDSIDRLARLGIASGVGGFEYRPRSAVRRDAMASLVMRGADHLVESGRTRPPR